MINLRINEECNECPEFEVEQNDIFADDKKLVILTCRHFSKCRRIKAYLKKEVENAQCKCDARSD